MQISLVITDISGIWVDANYLSTPISGTSNRRNSAIALLEKLFTTQAKCKVKLSLYLCNYALRHEGVCGSGCIYPHSLDLGKRWKWMVSFTPRLLYSQRKSPRHSLDRRLGELKDRSIWRSKHSWPYRYSNSDALDIQPAAIPTVLRRLFTPWAWKIETSGKTFYLNSTQ
jgi:hypothetical protein